MKMKDEYDFSGATRGKFYRAGSQVNLPVYLDEEVLAYLRERANAKGVSLSEMVNELLKRDIGLVEAMKG